MSNGECVLSDEPSELEEIIIKFRDKLLDKVAKFEDVEADEALSTEQQLKSYIGFFKLLQSLEDMIKRVQQEREKKSERGVDILEFRRELEEQIAKLVDAKTQAIIP